MFNLGLDNEQALMQQYQNNGYNPACEEEDIEPSPRGEEHTPVVEAFTSHLLRLGYLLQTGSLFLMILFYIGFGGTGIFVFDLYAGPEAVKLSTPFHLVTAILTSIYLVGTLSIGMFQVFVADNSKWTRGFRIGSKILSSAVTLDALSMSLRLMQYLYAYFYMGMKWWSKYHQTKAEWCIFNFGNLLNAQALFLYGIALFYLEAYHDDGTFEEYAWINLFLFISASAAELLMVFTGYGAFFTILLLIAMGSATFWSFNFEPLLKRVSPDLHSREVNADVLPDDMISKSGSTASGLTGEQNNQNNAMQNTQEMNNMNDNMNNNMNNNSKNNDNNHSINQQYSLGNYNMPEAVNNGFMGEEIPTQYDYSQLSKQVSQGVEMGMVNNPYQQ